MDSEKVTYFNFTGSGKEYFSIWLTNTIFSIFTLGIYSAWAKAKKLQYFYQHTYFQEENFNFHANPVSILKGKIISAFFILISYFIFYFSIYAAYIYLGIIFLLFPLFLVKSLNFYLENLSYKGIRFRFTGNLKQIYTLFIKHIILNILTCTLIYPYTLKVFNEYIYGNINIGDVSIKINIKTKKYYFLCLKYFGFSFLIVILFGIIKFLSGHIFANLLSEETILIASLFFIFYIIYNYFSANIYKLVFNGLSIQSNNMRSTLNTSKYLFLHILNFFLVIITFGLYKPFADISVEKLLTKSSAIEMNNEISLQSTHRSNESDLFSQSSDITNSLLGIDLGV